MARLLQVNFARLWKTKTFWICLALAAGLSISSFFSMYSMRPIYAENIGSALISNGSSVVLLSSILTGLYLGTDYSNGTIRNKLTVGRTRIEIYFANLITTAAAGVILLASTWISVGAVGLCVGGKLGMPAEKLALDIAVCICAMTALSAIFTVIGMLLSSKSTIVTLTIIAALGMMMSGRMILSALAESEFVSSVSVDEDGNIAFDGQEPNPMYVSGIQRDVITVVNDVLPSGQLVQVEMGSVHNEELMPLYSLGVLAVSTVVGALVFRKKDLK